MKFNGEFQPLIGLQNIIEHLPGCIYWCDKKGNILGCNQAQAEYFNLEDESSIIGLSIYDFYNEEQALFLKEIHTKVLKKDEMVTLEEFYIQPDRRKITLLSKKVPLRNNQGKIIGVLSSSVDISNQRQVQEEKTWLLEDIIGKIPGHIWWKDKNCRFLGCNDNQAKIAGLTRAEICGKSAYDLIVSNQPEEERRKQAEAIDAIDKQIMASGKSTTVEEPLTLPNGKVATYLSHKEPLLSREGETIGLVGIAFDITAEKEKVIAEQKAKTSAVLAASIAHELRTPLATINLLSSQLETFLPSLIQGYRTALSHHLIEEDLSEQQLDLMEEAGQYLKKVLHSANIFINMMLMKVNLEQPKSTQLLTLSMVEAINEALSIYPFRDSELTLLEWNMKENEKQDFFFRADPTLFNHLIFNLLKNALYYVKTVPHGTIKIWLERVSRQHCLHFKDTGPGISAKILPHIFDMFYSKTNHGSGVGLALCKIIMSEFGGNITCESAEGRYTHFILKFPELNDEKEFKFEN